MDLKIKQFVRGTLRYKGWKNAWGDIFSEVDTLDASIAEARLKEISDDLWDKYSYKDGEVDRVILTVELKVENELRWFGTNNILWILLEITKGALWRSWFHVQ